MPPCQEAQHGGKKWHFKCHLANWKAKSSRLTGIKGPCGQSAISGTLTCHLANWKAKSSRLTGIKGPCYQSAIPDALTCHLAKWKARSSRLTGIIMPFSSNAMQAPFPSLTHTPASRSPETRPSAASCVLRLCSLLRHALHFHNARVQKTISLFAFARPSPS